MQRSQRARVVGVAVGIGDHLGMLNQHPQEGVDNICDYGHLSPIHGSALARFENEIKGPQAIQHQCGGHRTQVVEEGGVRADLHTITSPGRRSLRCGPTCNVQHPAL